MKHAVEYIQIMIFQMTNNGLDRCLPLLLEPKGKIEHQRPITDIHYTQ